MPTIGPSFSSPPYFPSFFPFPFVSFAPFFPRGLSPPPDFSLSFSLPSFSSVKASGPPFPRLDL